MGEIKLRNLGAKMGNRMMQSWKVFPPFSRQNSDAAEDYALMWNLTSHTYANELGKSGFDWSRGLGRNVA